jgi:CBS domain-containing protein
MRIEERMTKDVKCCAVQDSLAAAARILWEHDFGCAPVIDEGGHLHGMLTDRDICMAAYISGRGLHDLKVADIMTRNVASVRPQESLRDAELLMRARGVRRLPVVDDQRRVIGLLSCNDLCRWVDDGGSNDSVHHDAVHLVRTLATVGRPRVAAANGTPQPAGPLVLAGSPSPRRTQPTPVQSA